MPAQRIFKTFIDDSGEKEYGQSTGRYFVYAGVVIDSAAEKSIVDQIGDLKFRAFKVRDVEIKSNWLRRPQERERRYIKKYGITDSALTQFTDDLHDWISTAPLTFVASVVDKKQMKERYGEKAWHPSATAYQFLLQRYELHLCGLCSPVREHPRANCTVLGYVTLDNMDGASPAANQWRDLLRNQHRAMKKRGCQLTQLRFDHLAETLRFGDSAKFDLIQIADLAAYNVMRQFRSHGDTWDDPSARQLPLYPYLERMIGKFMRGEDGRFAGWGVVKWPNDAKKRWCLDLG